MCVCSMWLTACSSRRICATDACPILSHMPSSAPLRVAEALQRRGPSKHCGGSGWAISRAALAAVRPQLSQCLEERDVVLGWCDGRGTCAGDHACARVQVCAGVH